MTKNSYYFNLCVTFCWYVKRLYLYFLERTINGDERMLDILDEWGAHKEEVKFFLHYSNGELSPYSNNNTSKPDLNITNSSMTGKPNIFFTRNMALLTLLTYM